MILLRQSSGIVSSALISESGQFAYAHLCLRLRAGDDDRPGVSGLADTCAGIVDTGDEEEEEKEEDATRSMLLLPPSKKAGSGTLSSSPALSGPEGFLLEEVAGWTSLADASGTGGWTGVALSDPPLDDAVEVTGMEPKSPLEGKGERLRVPLPGLGKMGGLTKSGMEEEEKEEDERAEARPA